MLPILLIALLFLAISILTGIAGLGGRGDLSRWAAVSTIWLILPTLVAGLILLALLVTMIYLVAKLTQLLPPYSYQAQRFMRGIEGGTKRGAEMVRRPRLAVQALGGLLRTGVQRLRERI